MPPSSADGSQDARSFFKCIACELVFHGDCEGLSVGEKKVAQKVSSMSQKDRAKLGAICLRCSISARAVWRAATQDACKITELLSVLGANKMRRAQVIKLAEKFEVPELAGELLEYHVKYHEPPEAEGEEARIALIKELEELSSDILLSRVPDGNLTDERMVAIFKRHAQKEAAKQVESETEPEEAEGEDSAVPGTITKAGASLMTGLANASKKRKLILAPEEPADDDAAEGVQGPTRKANHPDAIPCPGCNLPGKTWEKSATFYRHLREPKPCYATGKFQAKDTPMDLAVQLSLRAGYEIAPKHRPASSSRAPAAPALPPCAYCGDDCTSESNVLLKCVSYTPVETPLAANWFATHKASLCTAAVHLDCVRTAQKEGGDRHLYQGDVPIEEAGRNVIGFCPVCFEAMEAARTAQAAGEDSPAPP